MLLNDTPGLAGVDRRARRLGFSKAVVAGLATIALGFAGAAAARPYAPAKKPGRDRGWVAAAEASALASVPYSGLLHSFHDVTVRQRLRLTAPAARLRVTFCNGPGGAPIRIGSAHLALAGAEPGSTQPQSDHALTFHGRTEAVVPPGGSLTSDPAPFAAAAGAPVEVSVFYPDAVTPPGHLSHVFVSAAGDHGAEATMPAGQDGRGFGFACEVDAAPAAGREVLVAFGDSITEGFHSTLDADRDWPSQFYDLISRQPGGARWAVVNAGISGNRLISRGTGPSALERFDHDALDLPGVRAVILLEGVNDIGRSNQKGFETESVTALDLIAADKALIARAHARGIKIYGGTLTPFEGAAYYSDDGEAKREALNAWIRSSGAFDGVIDFDAAVRDPQDPRRFSAAADSGDHLHPGDAGYRRMAQAARDALFPVSHASATLGALGRSR